MKFCITTKKSRSFIICLLLSMVIIIGLFVISPATAYAQGEVTVPKIVSVGGIEVNQETAMGGAPSAMVGQPYSAQVVATGGDLTYSAGSGEYMKLPKGLNINAETGLISGTCTEEVGRYNCLINATNAMGEASVVIGITVGDSNCIPGIETAEGSLGQTYKNSNSQFTVSATNNNASMSIYNFSWSIKSGALPDGMKLSYTSSRTVYITGTPTATGTFNFELEVKNDFGTASRAYSISVVAGSVSPNIVASGESLGYGVVGKPYEYQLEATGTNSNEDPMLWSTDSNDFSQESYDLGNGLSMSKTGLITGTPQTNKQVSFTVYAKNSVGTDYEGLYIHIYNNGEATTSTITPEVAVVAKGSSKEFTISLEGYGDVEQVAYWSFWMWDAELGSAFPQPTDSQLSVNTSTPSKTVTLTVGENETRGQIRVVAYSKPGNGGVKTWATVTIVEKNDVIYNVSFNANGGTGEMASVPVVENGTYKLPACTFTAPDGKIFKAWSVNDVEKQVGDTITVNANTVVKAVWEDNVYRVIYQPGEASGNNEPYEYQANQTITFLDCEVLGYTREGFEFDYWSIRILGDNLTEVAQKRPNETYTLTTDIIAVAMWKEVTAVPTGITATYSGTILAGNKINPSSISIMLNYSNSSNEPVNAGIVEYWYNGSQIQDPINYVFGVELIGNLNITVKYQGFETTMAVQVVGYEITFNANTGSGTMESVEYVGAYTLPTCAFTAPDGKQFKGWSTSANGEVINETTYNVTEPVTLYAIWENIPHECVGVLESGQGATCTVDGWKDYYRCECGKYYEDENCTKLISDLEAWKVGDGKIVAEHTYGDLIPEDPAVHTQTELKAGMRAHYHCSVCDTYFDSSKNETTAIALTIPAPTHSFGDWIMDDEKHWKVCSCGLKSEENSHDYTDSSDMTCNTCGYDRTVPHTHGNGVLQSGQAATCTVNGWKDYYKCSCGKIYADAACTNEITSLEEWKNGDGKIVAEHTYGSLIQKVNATCSQTGMEAHYECSVCHTLFDENKAVKTENELTIAIDGSAHEFGVWTSNGDGTHTRVCGINGNHKETVACSGGTATCTEKAVCEVCNTPYGNTTAHEHGSEWHKNADEHWNECACGDKANTAPHADENNDGKCDTCEYAMGNADNPGGDKEPEKTGLSGGAIAGIVVGSVAVAGLGGFAIFWFVIKKKKFADLLALFKKK